MARPGRTMRPGTPSRSPVSRRRRHPGGLGPRASLPDDGHGLLYRLSLPGFTPRGTLAGAAFDLGVTIAGPSSGTAFRFRGGRLLGRGDDAGGNGGPMVEQARRDGHCWRYRKETDRQARIPRRLVQTARGRPSDPNFVIHSGVKFVPNRVEQVRQIVLRSVQLLLPPHAEVLVDIGRNRNSPAILQQGYGLAHAR